MGEPSVGVPPSEIPLEDRLDSWKEIAAYLNRDVTTVQRWEKRERMPVHRHLHDRMGSVYASRVELDAWMRGRGAASAEGNRLPSSVSVPLPGPLTPISRSRKPLVYLSVALCAVLAIGLTLWLRRAEVFWRNPIANARIRTITELGSEEQAAAISPEGQFIAFLSNRDGQMDVWLTQSGSGQFHNLTLGHASDLVNTSIRTLGFSQDGQLVTFWTRRNGQIGVWGVPMLGGEPRPYLEGVAEYDWSRNGNRLAYHRPGAGDPLFVSDGNTRSMGPPIFTAPAGMHAHFPLWSPDGAFLYFVQGTLPDKLDIWRISPAGGTPERITSHNARVSYPAFLDRRTLLYLATDSEGDGPWLYSIDVEHRIPHQLSSGLDRYTSLAATADGRHLVVTAARPRTTLWSMRMDASGNVSAPVPISLSTGTGHQPRLGPDFLLYVSVTGDSASLWKNANGVSTQLWTGDQARIIGAPAISSDGRRIAFSASRQGKSILYLIQSDGTNLRTVTDSLALQGSPAWAPDEKTILSAAIDQGAPRIFRIPVNGGPPIPFVRDYSIDPASAPGGNVIFYSGPDVGTTFAVKAATTDAAPHPLPALTLTRGARHIVLLPGGHDLVVLRGEIEHKDLWRIDLDSGAERQLTNLPSEFNVQDFDISPDGQQIVLERVEAHSDVLLFDLNRP